MTFDYIPAPPAQKQMPIWQMVCWAVLAGIITAILI